MNRSIIRFLISKLLLIEAGLLVVPLVVALIYHEDAKVFGSILGTMGILLLLWWYWLSLSLNQKITIFTQKKECSL